MNIILLKYYLTFGLEIDMVQVVFKFTGELLQCPLQFSSKNE